MMATSTDPHDLTLNVSLLDRIPSFIGSYSVVYRAVCDGELVAVKIIRAVGDLHTMRRKVLRERTVWGFLNHPNILPFFGHADDDDFQPFGAFVSPWYSNGDAGRFLERHSSSLDREKRLSLWEGVINGVAFLHSRSPVIVHGDLKPGNILIDDEYNSRICDFGLARIIQEESTSGMTTTTEHTGTERYLAPELVTQDLAAPSTESDVYALGCLGLEFIYLRKPYAHRLNNNRGCIIVDIRDGVPPAIHDAVADTIWDPHWAILSACWDRWSENRPSSGQLVQLVQDADCSAQITSSQLSSQLESPSESTVAGGFDTKSIHMVDSSIGKMHIHNSSPSEGHWTGSVPPPRRRARVQTDYVGHDDELTVKRGDILDILESSTNWCKASKADGTFGVVPLMYLDFISPQEELELSDTLHDNEGLSDSDSASVDGEPPALFRARALHDYVASGNDPGELSFARGDVFDIVEKFGKWWYTRRADGIYGNVPAKFLVVL